MFRVEEKIIKFLADYPQREFYVQEVASKIKCSKASASIILTSLFSRKIVGRVIKGHMKFYQINTRNTDVKKFKINFILENIKPVLSKLEKYSKKIILFGSTSRGEQTINSDVDVLIVTHNKKEVSEIVKKNVARLPIKAILKTPSEWAEMEMLEAELYQEIKSGIILY